MSHELNRQLDCVRRRARGHLLLWAAGQSVCAIVATLLAWSVVDFIFRFEQPIWRILGTAIVAGAVVFSAWRWLIPAARVELSDAALASRIGRRYPQLGEPLLCCVQLLDQSADSAALRHAAIERVTKRLRSIDPAEAVDTRPSRRAARRAGILLLACATIIAISPDSARVALARLAAPVGTTVWPQRNNLKFTPEVRQVVRGAALQTQLVDRNGVPLPSPITLEFAIRGPDGTEHVERQIVEPDGDSIEVRREHITRPIRYRARGGDDRTMSWIDVALLDPPRVDRTEIEVTPPASTGLASVRIDRNDFTVPAGSALTFTVTADRPVAAAQLSLSDGRTIVGRIDTDRSPHEIMFGAGGDRAITVERNVQYWITLTDPGGVATPRPRRYSIGVVTDLPPKLTILAPRDRSPVLPTAVVSLVMDATDDYGLKRLTLRYRMRLRSDEGSAATANGDGAETDTPSQHWKEAVIYPREIISGEDETPTRLRRSADDTYSYAWPVAPDSADGTVELAGHGRVPFTRIAVDYFVTATDGADQMTRSSARQLVGVDRASLDRHVEALQHGILSRLEQAETLQHRIASRLDLMQREIDLAEDKGLSAQRMVAIESDRRQLAEQLFGVDGLNSLLAWLRTDLAQNGADTPETRSALSGLAAGSREIGGRLLQELTVRLAALAQRVDSSNILAVRAANQRIGDRLASLMEMLGDWLSVRDFRRQIDQIRTQSFDVLQRMQQLPGELLGRDMSTLSSNQRSQLQQLSRMQRDIAQRLAGRIRTMRAVLDSLGGEDVETVARLTDSLDALYSLDEDAVAAMLEVADRIATNRISRAIELQSEIVEMLEVAIARLDDDRRRDLRRRVDRIRAIEKSIGMLARRQAILGRDIENVAQTVDPASRADRWRWILGRQTSLATDSRATASLLTRLRRATVAAEITQAIVRMDDVVRRSQSDQADQATQAATASLRYLLEARRLIIRIRMQAEADLAAEDMLFLQITLDRILPRQLDLRDRAARLADSDAAPQVVESSRLAAEQRTLAAEIVTSADSITKMTAVAQLLRQAAEDMQSAAGDLQNLRIGASMIAKMDAAIETLRTIETAIRTEIAPQIDPLQPPSPQESDANAGPETVTATEVQLLLTTQESINERIAMLPDGRDRSKLTPEDRAAYSETAERQRRLVEAAVEVLRAGEDETSRLLREILEGAARDFIEREAAAEAESEIDRPAPPLIPLLPDDQPMLPDRDQPSGDNDLLDELFADDPLDSLLGSQPPVEPTVEPTPPADDKTNAETDEQPQESDPLARQLGTAGVSEEESPLIEATRLMRMVQTSLEDYRADRAQPTARQVVSELQRLLKQAKSQAASADSQTDASRAQSGSTQGTGDPMPGGGDSTADGSPTGDPISVEQMEFLIDQFRGQLPPRARAQLMNIPAEQFHPKYRRWIEQYYRRMAEREDEDRP